MKPVALSIAQARHIALASLGFAQPRLKRKARVSDLAKIIRQLGLVQLDYVNVLAHAHHL